MRRPLLRRPTMRSHRHLQRRRHRSLQDYDMLMLVTVAYRYALHVYVCPLITSYSLMNDQVGLDGFRRLTGVAYQWRLIFLLDALVVRTAR